LPETSLRSSSRVGALGGSGSARRADGRRLVGSFGAGSRLVEDVAEGEPTPGAAA
jgi:hypothetical protein